MRILVISAYYTPEIAASLYIVEDILKGFVDAGHTVELFTPTPTRGISTEIREKYKNKKLEKKFDGKLIIHRISMFREGKNTIIRALRYLLLNTICLWKGINTEADVIFVQSTPPTQGFMAGVLSLLKDIPYIYNVQDVFPDSLVNTGMSKQGSWIWKIGRIVEKFSYYKATKIIVITEEFKHNLLLKGVPEEKIKVIPNWADTSAVFPIDRECNLLIKKYNLNPERFFVTYTGNIGLTQNMDLLLDVAKAISQILPEVFFVVIGDGVDKERVQNRLNDEKINNVLMLPFQPYEDIAHVFSLGDVGLIVSKAGVGNNSVPSKTWNIMAAKRPVVASFDKESKLCQFINDVGFGICADSGDALQLIKAIQKLYEDKDYRNMLGTKGYRYLREFMNPDVAIREYVKQVERE